MAGAVAGDDSESLAEILAPQFYQLFSEPTITYSTDYGLIDARATLEGSEVLFAFGSPRNCSPMELLG